MTEHEVESSDKNITKELDNEVKPSGKDQKPARNTTPEEKKTRNKKAIKMSIIAVVIIGLAIGVYFVSPPNMEPGQYQVDLTFTLSSDEFAVSFNITMASEAKTTKTELISPLGSSGKSYIIIYNQAYKSATNSKIEFYAGILNETNQPFLAFALQDISGKITGENLDRTLRPTEIKTIRSSSLSLDARTAYFSMAVPYKAGISMPLLIIVAGLWLTEVLPTIIGALLVPAVVALTQISSASSALQPFFDPVIALFFGGFIIAEALKKNNIDRRFALGIAAYSTSNPNLLLLIFLAFTAFLSLWMSNTAVAAVTVPIAIALVDQIQKNEKNEKSVIGYRKALILGAGYAATIGGIGTIVGTPSNPIAVASLAKVGQNISFLQWLAFGLPVVIILVIVLWGHLLLMFRPKVSRESMRTAQISFKADLKKMGKMNKKQWATIAIFLLTIVLWLIEEPMKKWFGGRISINSGVAALIAAILIFAFNILEPKEIKNINWGALLLFGGGLCLGNALVSTGIGDWVASKMGIIEGQHIIVIALVLAGIGVVVTAIASNTASAAMLIPLVIPIAVGLNVDLRLLAVVVAISTSIDFTLVFGTPPTLISYSTGYFKVKEIFKVGSILSIIGLVILSTVMIYIWKLFQLITL
ncbi:MAG: DASS family sodium-coupled anion symporter [Candidatus Heimdallarchaeota archaeon]|nr:DASS family sodium-coupled anion symporter [Candidatus Heimdallarchaeota archaeon]